MVSHINLIFPRWTGNTEQVLLIQDISKQKLLVPTLSQLNRNTGALPINHCIKLHFREIMCHFPERETLCHSTPPQREIQYQYLHQSVSFTLTKREINCHYHHQRETSAVAHNPKRNTVSLSSHNKTLCHHLLYPNKNYSVFISTK